MIFAAIACMVSEIRIRSSAGACGGSLLALRFGAGQRPVLLRRLLVVVSTLAALAASPAYGAICAALEPGPTGRVVSISDGDTFDLDSGLTVRLVGIQAPKLPLGRDGFVAWPLGDEAKNLI